MPELPEIEITKRSSTKMVKGSKIIDIKIFNKNLRYKISNTFAKSLVGEKILKISRRSKYLIFHFRKKLLLAHLGMSGKLLLVRNQDNKIFKTSFYYDLKIIKKHNHIYFFLNNGFILIYNDVRRFGFLKIYKTNQIQTIPFIKKLGLEPLSKIFDIKFFKKFINYI